MKKMIFLLFVAVFCMSSITVYGQESAVYKIGSVLPLTGDIGIWGQKLKKGIDLAVEKINKEGGVNNHKLEVIYEDDQNKAELSVSSLRKLITVDKVPAIIGPFGGSPVFAMAPIVGKEKIVLMSPCASNPKAIKASEYIFSVWVPDIFEGEVLADFVAQKLNLKKAALLYVIDDYGLGLKEIFTGRLEGHGGKVMAAEAFNLGDSDFRTQLTKVWSKKPEVIYMIGYYKEMAGILRQAKELAVKTQFLAAVGFREEKTLDLAGDTAEGVIFTIAGFDRNSKEKAVYEYVTSWKKKYPDQLAGFLSAHGYDALQFVAAGIQEGGYDGPKIREALVTMKDFPGATGKMTFNEYGGVSKEMQIMTVRDGKYVAY